MKVESKDFGFESFVLDCNAVCFNLAAFFLGGESTPQYRSSNSSNPDKLPHLGITRSSILVGRVILFPYPIMEMDMGHFVEFNTRDTDFHGEIHDKFFVGDLVFVGVFVVQATITCIKNGQLGENSREFGGLVFPYVFEIVFHSVFITTKRNTQNDRW